MEDKKVKELWDKIVDRKLNKLVSEQEDNIDKENDTENEETNDTEDKGGNTDFVSVISKLFHSQNQVHIFHLQTKSQTSFAEHMALGGFYSEIGGLIDGLVESYQGKYDIITGYKHEEYDNYSGVDQLISYFKDLVSDVESLHKSVKESYIQNQLDTIEELIYSTLYKLRFLK